MKIRLTALSYLVLGACSGQADHRPERTPPATVPNVDLNRYSGNWYEIARYPNRFEDTPQYSCVGVTASYALRDDAKIDVTNTCRKDHLKGEVTIANGTARSLNTQNTKLKVRFAPAFIPFAEGDYWVLGLTEDYSAALVGDPDGYYLWILSRSPQLEEGVLNALLEKAEAAGYDTAPLYFTPQRPKIESPPF